MKEVPIMALDAAFANTGIALGTFNVDTNQLSFKSLALVQTEADKKNRKVVRRNSDDLRRARLMVASMTETIQDYRPHFVFCEVPSGTQSARASWALGIAVGVIAYVANQVPLIQVSPTEVKEVVTRATGEKHPDKEQIIEWATKAYPDLNWPVRGGKIIARKAEHLADAIAAAHAGVKSDDFRAALSLALRVM